MESKAPKRFQYRLHQYEDLVFSDEWDVLVAGESIGTVVRRDVTEGYYGAWKAVGEWFSTRREASVAVWKKSAERQA